MNLKPERGRGRARRESFLRNCGETLSNETIVCKLKGTVRIKDTLPKVGNKDTFGNMLWKYLYFDKFNSVLKLVLFY